MGKFDPSSPVSCLEEGITVSLAFELVTYMPVEQTLLGMLTYPKVAVFGLVVHRFLYLYKVFKFYIWKNTMPRYHIHNEWNIQQFISTTFRNLYKYINDNRIKKKDTSRCEMKP